MSRRLQVRQAERVLGRVEQAADARFSFTYDTNFLGRSDARPISASLPLRPQPYAEVAHHFFSNLLPEAEVRRLLCQRLGISVDNDFELLAAIGGDCAGALSLVPEETPGRTSAPRYRPLPADELEELAKAPVLAAIDGRDGLRLSLAGAQDKLPVLLEGEELFLPLGDAPSSHILKFPNRGFKHLPGNEVLVMGLARSLGLPVPEARLWTLGKEGACLVKRYDRAPAKDGMLQRLHQEDLCQVLGLPPILKYEKEGGPSFSQCFGAVREASVDPLTDARNLLRWLIFNVLVLNADAHAKNLSVLYGAEGLRLAPFYDLLCTRAYPRLSRELAMSVGGERDPALLRRKHWDLLARELQLGPRLVIDTARELAERLPDAATATARDFRERYGERPALQLVLPKVRAHARKAVQLWRT